MLALAILGFGTLIASRRMMRARLVAVGDEVMGRGRTDFKVTLIAAGYTAVLALTWPALIWAAGWFLTINPSAPTFVAAVGEGAQAAALALLPFALLIEVCAPRGLADAHLAWPESCRRALKLNIGAMMFWVVSLVFVVSVLLNQEDESLMESLGRLAMIAASIVLSVHLMRMLRPRGTVLGPYIERHPHGWINRLRFAWYGAVVALPLALVALSAAGYTRTAIHFSSQLYGSVWMVLIAVLLFALSERFVIVARHRLALERERRRREEAAMRGADDDEAPAKTAPPAPAGADLDVIDAQTRRLVTITLGFALLVGFWFVWVDVMPALGILKNVTVWSSTQPAIDSEGLPTTQMMTVSLADVLLALAILFMGFVGARNIPGVLEIAILSRLPLNSGLRFAITTLTRYAITVVCFIAAFGLIGVSWSKVQWLVAAMTVGLGFGLQEIFANFVSGLIILFERPIRVGDIVTVGEISGSVSQINMRATTIVDWDRRELIVPNKEFITNRLINWTLTDPITRVVFEIGIAYGSNTELARELLVKAAANDPNVMKDPPPHARFISFGDSALIFRLYTFIPVRDVYLDMVHALNTEIDQSFRKAGIEIAFPQRDLHLDASAPIPVRMIETSEGRAGGPIVEMPGAPELSRASKD
jgi:potassium efflux system protein